MTDIEALFAEKSALVLQLERAKIMRETKKVVQFASNVGALERTLADYLTSTGAPGDAVVNLISAGSCFVDARRTVEARRAFELALELTDMVGLRAVIQDQLHRLPSERMPGLVFTTAEARVTGNTLLRRPQAEAYDAAQRHFSSSTEHAIIQLPVGCGKTGTMSVLPFGIASGRALVVAPNREIARNLRKNFDYSDSQCFLRKQKVLTNGQGPTCAVLDDDANIFDADSSDFVVANIQQIVAGKSKKWLSQFAPDYFDIVLFDEGHHNAADSWRVVHDRFPKAKFASFTATPIRADGKRVEGKHIYRFPIGEAIRDGFIKNIVSRKLEPTTIEFVYGESKQRHSLEEVLKLREESWFSKGVALAPECNRNIANAAIQCMQELRAETNYKHQIIAAACTIDHARAICSIFRERNLQAEVLHSKLSDDEQEAIRAKIERQEIDAVVHVAMLGEGADYPSLSVAAIFRPYRHIVPYIQFVGRIMRVVKQNAPGHPDNRGFVVSHVGLHVDRWWDELKELDGDDQQFFEELATGSVEVSDTTEAGEERRRFTPEMKVLEEQIERYVQEHFIDPADASIMVQDLVATMRARGFDLEVLGVTEEQIAQRLVRRGAEVHGSVASIHVQPQRARQEAQRRLNERVRAGAKELLNELGLKPGGRALARLYPRFQATADLPVAIILLNKEVSLFLQVGSDERSLLTEGQARLAHDAMDSLIDKVASEVRPKLAK